MEIKVQCGCGAKYSFDIEPVNGEMPITIACPKCGADGTPAANAIIQQKLAAAAYSSAPQAAPPAAAAPAPKSKLKVAGGDHGSHAAPAAPGAPAAAVAAGGTTMCTKHFRNVAEANCYVCQKPICMECMSLFGYLCSVQCKYKAEQQRIAVPKCPYQKTVVEGKFWRKTAGISAGIMLAILGMFALYVWFYFAGSHPKQFYKLSFNDAEAPLDVRFLGKDKLLLLKPESLVVHDLKKKKDLWTAALSTNAAPGSGGDEADGGSRRSRFRYSTAMDAKVFLGKEDIWVALPKQLLSFDRNSGAQKQSIALPGQVISYTGDTNAVTLVCAVDDKKRAITRVNLDSAEVKTEDAIATPTQRDMVAVELPAGISPTAAFLLDRELDPNEGKVDLKKVYGRFVPAGDNVVEMQVRMVQPNKVAKQTMKAAGPSSINENTSAATGAGRVAEEVFNDIKRSRTGGFRYVDESRYSVTLKRLMAGDTQPWVSEVVGPPALFPQKSVDVLVAGKAVYFFDKQNNKVAQATLTYPIDEGILSWAPRVSPCVEADTSLYFFDQGVLTAFDMPSANVRWRLTSVGISKVVPDGKGHLYVVTTTGSPEDIEFPDQIKITDPPQPLLMKVDAGTGKILWKVKQVGIDCELSGKFVYTLNEQTGGGPGLAVGLGEALNSPMSGSTHFRIFRINPSSGKTIWEFYNQGAPEQVDFEGNRIVMRFPYEVRVFKYLTF